MAIDSSGDFWVGSEPGDMKEYLAALTWSNDGYYPVKAFRLVKCPCGSIRFKLERAMSLTRRTCTACRASRFICLDADRGRDAWEEAEEEEGAESFSCAKCRGEDANIGVGFAKYDDPDVDGVKWIYVGVRCADCGILGCFNDSKVGRTPSAPVYDSV
jgi:hypothetical protein